ncbi:MAG: hypothetical protein AVDCRST_MAG85-2569 [uncultured Solirubrobacteraceae bacterium]|uniref:Uncharacterized protein n=1 Tax=uncultured Solirubrobacteraceae bacterium TaxID=1162706 RepID=A0A6J4T7D6_9ACTN|nr:MAG: hypothetical protein AVDCRST_MAG85-2569 [uncultured Solirubrobacteraceae bacterium]
MPIHRDDRCSPSSPAEVTADLCHQLTRAGVAVARLLGDDLGRPTWSADDVAAELSLRLERRLHDFVVVFGTEDVVDSLILLAEAIDNLGMGETLEVSELVCLWSRLTR